MSATRLTLTITLPQGAGGEDSLPPRERFWRDLNVAIRRKGLLAGETRSEHEASVYARFGEELKRRMMERVSGDWAQLEIKVVQIRYGSALLALDIYGLGPLLKSLGINEEFFVDMLERYSPDALVAAAYGAATTSEGTGMSARVQSNEPGGGLNLKGSRLLNAMGVSLLAPVLLSLLVLYVAFVEMHDAKNRYLEQNKILLDHYQSEIESLTNRLHFAESHPGGVDVGGAVPVQPRPPVTPEIPDLRWWIATGYALILGGVAVMFLWSKKLVGKIAAALMVLSGTAAVHGGLHVEIKSLEFKLSDWFAGRGDHGGGNKPVPGPTPAGGSVAVGPELLLTVEGFITKTAILPEQITPMVYQTEIEQVCKTWKVHNQSGKAPGMLLVVGGTDITPYRSNFELAQARAEKVRTDIVACGVDNKNVLAIVAGPQNTTYLAMKKPSPGDMSKDRRVQVWAVWAWPGNA
jgi:hypothetical protein